MKKNEEIFILIGFSLDCEEGWLLSQEYEQRNFEHQTKKKKYSKKELTPTPLEKDKIRTRFQKNTSLMYFLTKAKAKKCASTKTFRNDQSRFFEPEGYYKYLLIEAVVLEVMDHCGNEIAWYEYDQTLNGYKEIEKPKFAVGTVGFHM